MLLDRRTRRTLAAAFAIGGLTLLTLDHWDHFSVRDVLLSALIAAAIPLLILGRHLPVEDRPRDG